MRAQPLLGLVIGLAMLVAPCITHQRPLFIWNGSPSVPIGLYRIGQGSPRVGDLVLIRLSPAVTILAARRGYLPKSVYLLKPVAAVGGDRVCRFGSPVFVRGRFVGLATAADGLGRPMPAWHRCRTLETEQIFVLADHPASFDSRYFGPLEAKAIAGRAFPVWSHQSAN